MDNLIYKIKELNRDLKISEIAGILYLINQSGGITSADLILQTGLPKETLRTFKTSISYMLINDKEILLFKPEYIDQVKKLELREPTWSLLDNSEPVYEAKLREIRRHYSIKPKRDYDQFFATERTSVAKARMLTKKDGLTDKDIVLLGDDDFVSISLILLDIPFKSITILDIDEDILSTIATITKDLGKSNIHTFKYDARMELDSRLAYRFDVVVTDPPYTSSGIRLFLNRSVNLLKQDSALVGKYIYLYYGNSFKSPEKTLKIQEIISRFNLVIEDRIDKFARYNGAESIGSSSALYVLKTTPYTRVIEDIVDYSRLYTYEAKSEEKFPYVSHHTFKVFGVSEDLLKSKTALLKACGEFCRSHKLRVVDHKITKFKGEGVTLTFVLSNSNLLIHTWPEYGSVHVDLITCSPIHRSESMAETISTVLKSKSIESRKID